MAKKSRGVVLKSVGLTLLLFFGVWFGLNTLAETFLLPFLEGWTWLATGLIWLLGAGLVVTAGFLLAPVTAVFAGLFLDEIAEHVETHHYPDDTPGKPLALVPGIVTALQFGLLVLVVNLIALMLVWLAGFGVIIFFLANGYLLGREYFQFAAQRFMPLREANQLRRKYSLEVFLGGLAVAGFMSIPLLNLLTPVFAATLMVHIFKQVQLKSLRAQPGSADPEWGR